MALERLQKILARAGVSSRRAAEQLIVEGRITVNGAVIDRLGSQADPERDHIKVDGKLLRGSDAPRSYFAVFKPRAMITTLSDPEGRPTVADLLREARVRKRVFPVGRLDWDADGLLLLTDDGDLAYKVMHPKQHLPKVYLVKVKGNPGERELDKVRSGVTIEIGVRTLPAEVVVEAEEENGTRLRVTLVEGRQNQIKKMFERIGHPVKRLRRVSIGPLRLGKMRPGEVRPLTAREVLDLKAAVAVPGDAARRPPPRPRRAAGEPPTPPKRAPANGRGKARPRGPKESAPAPPRRRRNS